MWSTFVFAFILLVAMMVPFALMSKFAGFSWVASICLAPVCGIALIAVSGVALCAINIRTGLTGMCLASYLFALILFCIIKQIRSSGACSSILYVDSKNSFISLAIFLSVAVLFYLFFFVKPLDGPSSFIQFSDNASHLARIETMSKDGYFSTIKTGIEPIDFSLVTDAVNDNHRGYYPAGFHILSALLVNTFSTSAVLAENVVLFFFLSIVYPLSFFIFYKVVFDRGELIAAGLLSMIVFMAFPLSLITYGPLFPTMASGVCLPCAAAFFILAFECKGNVTFDTKPLIIFFVACFALFALQPNTIFALAVLLLPYCCHYLYIFGLDVSARLQRPARRFLYPISFILFSVVVWSAAYASPMFHDVVSFTWEKLLTPKGAILSVVDLSLRWGFPQVVLGAIVLVGFLKLCFDSSKRWLCVAYVLMAIIYIIGISTEGFWKHLLAGFWYTDPYRTAACVALFAIPIATVGIGYLMSLIQSLLERAFYGRGQDVRTICIVFSRFAVLVICAFFIAQDCCQPFSNPVNQFQQAGVGETRALPAMLKILEGLNKPGEDALLNAEEIEFLSEVKTVVGNDIVLNNPYDGSVFAYPLNDINVYYKGFDVPVSEDNWLIKTHINRYSHDADLDASVEVTHARYLLLLDTANYIPVSEDAAWSKYAIYPVGEWQGFENALKDGIQAELVLSKGKCCLYRVN